MAMTVSVTDWTKLLWKEHGQTIEVQSLQHITYLPKDVDIFIRTAWLYRVSSTFAISVEESSLNSQLLRHCVYVFFPASTEDIKCLEKQGCLFGEEMPRELFISSFILISMTACM
ncbi:hypothetical protein DPMN_179390 [Dreissena polymorpha]|uniref:Uncharacterized protein n=1 Tax=Dreissena polymorpha TaxID=45954 RepID=A0A9D4EEG0_DREPO|nr:hypothetical protein DPMN_179390 [Dreissena polymorpha]